MVAMMTRRALVGGALLAAIAVPLAATPASAASFTSVTIEGEGLSKPLKVHEDANAELFAAVLSQVAWMAGRHGQTIRPRSGKLGPRYTVVVFSKDRPRQRYELYPLATGGPRAFRPAAQPTGRVTAAWFYGRLNMSETLRQAGVPLPIRADALNGGIGGGIGDTDSPEDDAASAPADDLSVLMSQWRRLLALNGAVALLIAAGLAGFALLIRPRN